jgi:ABC-2 type transport system permease protein
MNAIRSEWRKIRTLKSFWIVALFCLFSTVGANALFAGYTIGRQLGEFGDPQMTSPFWGTTALGLSFTQMALTIFAVLTITNEYTFQTINTSLLTVPNRKVFFASKAVVLGVYTALVVGITLLVSFCINYAIAPEYHRQKDFVHEIVDSVVHGFVTPVLGQILVCLIFYAISFLLRNSAASIAAYIAIFTVIPTIVTVATIGFRNAVFSRIVSLLPDHLFAGFLVIPNTGEIRYIQISETEKILELNWWQNGVGLSIWALLFIIIGYIVFQKRDA